MPNAVAFVLLIFAFASTARSFVVPESKPNRKTINNFLEIEKNHFQSAPSDQRYQMKPYDSVIEGNVYHLTMQNITYTAEPPGYYADAAIFYGGPTILVKGKYNITQESGGGELWAGDFSAYAAAYFWYDYNIDQSDQLHATFGQQNYCSPGTHFDKLDDYAHPEINLAATDYLFDYEFTPFIFAVVNDAIAEFNK